LLIFGTTFANNYNYPVLDKFILSTSRRWSLAGPLGLAGITCLLASFDAHGQSLRKLEQRAINRTHLTFVNGDTVQRFTVTYDQPTPRNGRFYYWQGPTQILRTAGAYNGRLLTGDYQLTTRNGNLLVRGTFDKGLKNGEWRTWRPDGTPASSSVWRRGKPWGKTKYYDAEGKRIKPVAPPKPADLVVTPPTAFSPHFWQPTYWQGVVKRRKLRRAEKRKADLATPAPVKKVKVRKAKGQPGEPVPVKKVKLRKTKTQPTTPGTSPLPQAAGS
jgi:hypothetical protein